MAELEGTWPERVLLMQRNWIGRSVGAQVDFRIRTRRHRIARRRQRDDASPSSPPGRTRSTARRSSSSPPTPRWPTEVCAPDKRAELETYLEQVRQLTEIDRQSTERPKTGVDLGVTAINPVNGEQHAGLRRRLRAGRLRHRRDHGRARARPARPRLRAGLRPAGAGRRRHRRARPERHRHRHLRRRRARQLRAVRRPAQGRGHRARDRRPDRARARRGVGQLPAARLAALPPALLGLPDPGRALPDRRHRAGAGRPAADRAARTCAARSCTRAGSRRWPRTAPGWRRPARPAAARPSGTPTRWTRSSTRPGTSCGSARRTTSRVRSTPSRPRPGCRSTSTSAASSTRSCTCSTAASSPRCCTTWAWSTSTSPSRPC